MIRKPSLPTLRRYGLSLRDWRNIGRRQRWRCGVCNCKLESGKTAIDHEHAKGWRKMHSELRATFVRGLLCTFCNYRVLRRGMTLDRLRGAVRYLEIYEGIRSWPL